jgi:hypothetical protein
MAVLTLALGSAVLPAAAGAEMRIEYVRSANTVSAGTQAQASASCPGALNVSGGGSEAGGGYDAAGLNSTYPSSVSAWTSWYDSHGGTILFRTYAICIKDPATMDARTVPNGGTTRSRCSNQQDLTGGGVYSTGTYHQSAIRQSVPFARSDRRTRPPNLWQGNFDNISQPPVNVDFTTYAICHDEQLDVHYRRAHKIGPKLKRSSLKVECRPNERVLGGGGLAASLKFYLVESYPIDTNADPDKLPDNGWRVTLDNLDPYRETIGAHAVCVEP